MYIFSLKICISSLRTNLLTFCNYRFIYTMKHLFLLIALGIGSGLTVKAQSHTRISLPALFSDHVVLQQQDSVPVWGWGEAGSKVCIVGSWSSKDTVSARVGDDGRWMAKVKTAHYGGPYTLRIFQPKREAEGIMLEDVMLGEVWLCSGQSNMEWTPANGLVDQAQEIGAADYPQVRFFSLKKVGSKDLQDDCQATWECCSPDVYGLHFDHIPTVWDEGIPLGNGIMGTLVWQKGENLRLALDRADLWDLRPVKEFSGPDYSYKFICDAVEKKDLKPVYEMIDARTSRDIAPTKIPAGAIEFPVKALGEVASVDLDVRTAVCTIVWKNGVAGQFFTSATDRTGHFRFTNLPGKLELNWQAPAFEAPEGSKVASNALARLGYKPGRTVRKGNRITYTQKAYGDVKYEVDIRWTCPDAHSLEGVYCLTTQGTWYSEQTAAGKMMDAYTKDFRSALQEHVEWWKKYWEQCRIDLPDKVLERQWYLEMYKFGAASRKDAPPICLQAVWTADNGQTPPWRGDFHNDLNTQLSYWPGYASNHLEESAVFTDWLWRIKDNSEAYTRQFFGVDGLNVPCISTLDGKNLGGWNPYSHQPAASGWLAHHFYLQWKYSADQDFLKDRAYPWVKEAARYFEQISIKGADGKRRLPLSSSPEINDNSLDAWFKETTNFDLACIRFTLRAAREMAEALGLDEEAAHWKDLESEWPDFASDATGLCIAPGYPLQYTHRHLSHLLAIHPLGLLDVSQGKEVERLVRRSIHHYEEMGTRGWVGYSYSWLANMQARVLDGDAAARSLHIFIKAFCSPNSFHLNGDQLKKGYSGFTYRPFTLEGNFACASAIQEMLLQSHTGVIRVFPAVPEYWQDASFKDMRAMGAFLVSASMKGGNVERITVRSEKGGTLKILNPFTSRVEKKAMKPGECIEITE